MDLFKLAKKSLKQVVDAKDYVLSKPPEGKGDVSSAIAFKLGGNPVEKAVEIARQIKPTKYIENIETIGPYINFYFNKGVVAEKVINDLLEKKKVKQKPKTILVEFFQANSHKGVHIGHARTLFIGESISRLLERDGYKVIRVTYGGDIGPHVAKCLWGLNNLGLKPVGDKGVWLGKVYAKASAKYEESEKVQEEIKELTRQLYQGNPKLISQLLKTREWSIEHFKKIFNLSETKMDKIIWESEVQEKGSKLVKQFEKKGFLTKSEGAIIADLKDKNLGVIVIVRGDGVPLYPAKDIGLADYEFNKLKADKVIHVVGVEQQLYFQQLFEIFKRVGWGEYAKNSEHLQYELIDLKDSKMSSRKGNVVLFMELYEMLKDLAEKEMKERGTDLKNSGLLAMSSFKYGVLSQGLNKKIIFDPKEWSRFDGDTGAYLQYSLVRAGKILSNHSPKKTKIIIDKPIEYELIKKLSETEKVIKEATKKLDPSIIAHQAFEIASVFSKFYEQCPVVVNKINHSRLWIVKAYEKQLKELMKLMGIKPLKSM